MDRRIATHPEPTTAILVMFNAFIWTWLLLQVAILTGAL